MSWGRKKSERILSMSPLFKLGRIRIRKDQNDFIDEWIDYDSSIKNPKDDLLDAVEIALRTAGGILPGNQPDTEMPLWFLDEEPAESLHDLAIEERRRGRRRKKQFDSVLGDMW